MESLSRTIKELNYIEKYDSDYPDLIKRLNDCKIELSDISSTISDKAQELFYDEKTLIEAQKRLDEINLLKRKYGNTIEEILNYYDKCSEELFELKSNKDSVQAYENEASAILKRLYSESVELHNERVKCAEVFEKSILKELSDLEIKNASFKVDFKALPEFSENITVNENGLDDLEFLISPNMGQPLKSLSKTASGGEMARIMLAIKNISSDIENINTIIFDEIDTGISGNTAEVVAEKLFMISKGKQVIAVTHLSQLAAMADFHYLIEKKIIDNNTVTTVRLLDDELQIEEIARLAGGVDNNEYSIPHARQMKNKCIIFKNSF